MSDKIYYFCYGSNLWSKRIYINVKSAVKYGNGFVKDWKLTFSANCVNWSGNSADIVPQNDNIVWGTVWTISGSDLERLDRQEVLYRRIAIDVTISGTEEVIQCWTYVQKDENKTQGLDLKPSLAYKKVMIKGAVEQQLPEDYIKFLESVSDNGILNTGPPDLEL